MTRVKPGTTLDKQDLFDEHFLRTLENLHLVSKKAFNGTLQSIRKTKRSGSGLEFREHREYVAGDDFRSIDWNAFGRLDKLLCRLFDKEEDLSIVLGIDASASMQAGLPSKWETARKIAASLAYIGLANHDRVALNVFSGNNVTRLPSLRGKQNILMALEFLKNATSSGKTNLQSSVQKIIEQQTKPGLFVLISDFYDEQGIVDSLDTLLLHKYEPFVIQLHASKPLTHSWNGDMTLVDSETQKRMDVTITPKLLKEYSIEHKRFSDNIRRTCTSRAVSYVKASSDTDLEHLMMDVFASGGL